MLKCPLIPVLGLLAFAVATPATATPRALKAPAGKPTEKSFLDKPIEPIPPREEKPRAGWNGAYGGINAGGGFRDR